MAEYAVPILAGVACGLLAGAPYAVALWSSKRSRGASIAPGMIAVGVSIAVIALSVLAVWFLLREMLVPFTLTLVGVFFVVVTVGAVLFGRRPRP